MFERKRYNIHVLSLAVAEGDEFEVYRDVALRDDSAEAEEADESEQKKEHKFAKIPKVSLSKGANTTKAKKGIPVATNYDFDRFIITKNDLQLIVAIVPTMTFGKTRECVTEVVFAVHSLFMERKGQKDWNPRWGGSHVYTQIMNRSASSLKKRKPLVELALYIGQEIEAVEDEFKKKKSTFLCGEMKRGLKAKLDTLRDQSAIPVNPETFKLFAELYPNSQRDAVVALIEAAKENDSVN